KTKTFQFRVLFGVISWSSPIVLTNQTSSLSFTKTKFLVTVPRGKNVRPIPQTHLNKVAFQSRRSRHNPRPKWQEIAKNAQK
ncbi:MAG TPA: hypothetical protein PLP21_18945, partial [Pyrinomonadaceae bacterium]|nr:hypothetical protein [Pyrinomonadaceae bacterium]